MAAGNLAGRRSAGSAAVGALLAILTAYCVLFGGSFFGIYLPVLRQLTLAIVVIVLAVWGMRAIRDAEWRPRSRLSLGFGVALAAFGIGELLARAPRVGIEYLAWTVLLVALYLLLVQLVRHPATARPLMATVVSLLVLICVAYLASVVSSWVQLWSLAGLSTPPLRPGFGGLTYGNPSAVMTMSVLLLGASVAHLGIGTPARRAVAAVLAIAVLLVTILTGSRAGWLALAIACLVVGTAAAWGVARRRRDRPSSASMLRGRGALAAGIVATAGLFVALGPAIVGRALSGGEELRASYWIAAGRMFVSSPLVGVGPGGWVANRIGYTVTPETDYYIPHAHDLYVQTAAEFGLVGIVAGLVALALLSRLILPALRDAEPTRRRFAWAALFGTVYLGAHQLLDFYANFPAVLFAFALPIAWLDATASSRSGALPLPRWRTRRLPPLGRVAQVVAVGLVAAALGGSVASLAWAERSASAIDAAVTRLDLGDSAGALSEARVAIADDPNLPVNQFVYGLAAAPSSPSVAAVAFARSAAADDFPAAWLDLAALRHSAGDDAGARIALDRAMRLGAQQPALLFAAADLELRMGDVKDASDAFVGVLGAMPSLAGDSYWTGDPSVARIWPSVLARVLSTPARLQIELETGRLADAAQTAAGVANQGGREMARLLVAGWQGDSAALEGLDRLASAAPLDPSLPSWLAILYDRLGSHAEAARYRSRAELIAAGSSVAAHEVRVARPGLHGWIAGIGGQYYGEYTYRRRTPNEQLVNELPQLIYLDAAPAS